MLAFVARRAAGDLAGIATAACVVLYHPALFLASRPLGETVAIALLAFSLLAVGERRRAATPLAGLAAGVASLARPNLLVVPLLWAVARAWRRDFRGAVVLLAGVSIPVVPVAVLNFVTSGHFVPISANGGITLYHGNGPGALGVYTPPAGFSGAIELQRDEARRIASAETGRMLDDVDADRWFAHRALAARWSDPVATMALVARRAVLTLDTAEHGLDDAPALDLNPWRWGAPLPFAVLLGLAVFGWACGVEVFLALVGCAATPLIFYVSSRYRLPFAVLLGVPAGIGAARLVDAFADPAVARRRWRALAAGALAAAFAWLVPSGRMVRAENAAGIVNRAVALKQRGDLQAAEIAVRRAFVTDPGTPKGRFVLGSILEAEGNVEEAEVIYTDAVTRDPGDADCAGNLAAILLRRGAADEAIVVLRATLSRNPDHPVAWNNLVVALVAKGDRSGAAREAATAKTRGVVLDAELLRSVEAAR